MRPLLIFTLEIYISIQLYKATQIITIRPPSIVCFEIVSFINNHTQKGPNENSKSIKKVTSEAKRYLVAKIKTETTTFESSKENNIKLKTLVAALLGFLFSILYILIITSLSKRIK